MKKRVIVAMSVVVMLIGCTFENVSTNNNQQKVKSNTKSVVYASNAEQKNVYEEYNRLRRELWMSGKIEEARNLPCPVEKVKGAIWCGNFDKTIGINVEGPVSHLENSNVVFFFKDDGRYCEHLGTYTYIQQSQ